MTSLMNSTRPVRWV